MAIPTFTLARALAAGETVFSGWCSLPYPIVAEMIGREGFAAVTLEAQHGLWDVSGLLTGVAAVRQSGAAPVVRVPVGENFERESMERALAGVARRHDALRLRLTADEREATLRRSVACDGDDEGWQGESLLQEIDLRGLPDPEQQAVCQSMIDEMAAELDVLRGPISKAAVIELREGVSEFVWLAHRAAVDRASWSGLVRDLFDLCACGSDDAPPALPTRARSFLQWGDEGTRPRPGRDWRRQRTEQSGRMWRQATVTLSASETETLGSSLEASYRLGLRDGVLAALTWLLCEQDGSASPVLAVEFDRREDSGLVGCCSQAKLLRPKVEATDPGAILTAVKVALREVRTSACTELVENPPATVAGYLRVADLCEWRSSSVAPLVFGADFAGPSDIASADTPRWSDLELSCAVVDGELRVRCLHNGASTGMSVGSSLRGRLCAIADHCRSMEEAQLSAADFPLAGLEEGELATLLSELATDTQGRSQPT